VSQHWICKSRLRWAEPVFSQQYTIILVPIDNVNQILAQSSPFTIGAAITTATTTTRSTSTPVTSVAATSTGTARTATAPTTAWVSLHLHHHIYIDHPDRPTLVGTGASTTGGFGSTIRNTDTNVATGASSSSALSSTASNSTSTSAALPVRFDLRLGAVASVLSVFAGAVFVAL